MRSRFAIVLLATAMILFGVPAKVDADERQETRLHAWGRLHVQVIGPTALATPGNFLHAWLSVPSDDGGPGSPLEPHIAGKEIHFFVDGRLVCSSLTSETGYAACRLSLVEEQALTGFEVRFEGDAEWKPSYDRAGLVRGCARMTPVLSFMCVDLPPV